MSRAYWNSQTFFLAIMSVSAALSMLRGFIVAAILEPKAFALYATLYAAGVFLSSLVSFGTSEETIKAYPRMFAEGRIAEIIKSADSAIVVFLLRSAALAVVGSVALFAVPNDFPEFSAVAGASIGFIVACSSIYASAQRSMSSISNLAAANFIRAVVALFLAVLGALTFKNWYGALIGEIVAGFLGVFVSRALAKRSAGIDGRDYSLSTNSAIENSAIASSVRGSAGGLWVFWAFFVASIPNYLDRAFVLGQFGPVPASQYAFLILFVAAANVLMGILSQKAGPELVHMEAAGKSVGEQTQFALRWLFVFWALWISAMLFAVVAMLWGPATSLAAKYEIDTNLLLAATVIGLLQVTVLLDFLLISRDREKQVFLSSCAYFAVSSLAALITSVQSLQLRWFLWLLVVAKLAHVCAQVWSLSGVKRSGRIELV